MAVLLGRSVPTEVVVREAVEWRGLRPTWTGWNGTSFDFSSVTGGVMLMRGGVRGWNMPPIQRRTTESPSVAGSRWRGYRVAEREVFWPLYVWHREGSEAFVDRDRSFWRTMHPGRTGVWSVRHPDGTERNLTCRYVDDGGAAYDMAPSHVGWVRYGITLIAEQPFWQGEPITRSFGGGSSSDFFAGGTAPSFNISSGNTLATARIDNPGDESAWPVWTLHGPFTTATVGVSGKTVAVPFSLDTGERLVIDTNPNAQTAITGAGVERTGQLGAVNFAPVPAGASVPLSVSMVGTGSVDVSLTPLYHRAW